MNERLLSGNRLVSRLFFRLLPYQILLLAISAVNGIVDSLYASNVIGKVAMSAIGLYSPLNHFLYAASMMLVSGSTMLYGRYISKSRGHIQSVFSVDLVVSASVSVLTSLVLVIGVVTGITGMVTPDKLDLEMLNRYIIGQAPGIPALVVGQQLFAFLSLENRTKHTMAASIACLVTNAVMDHLFIVVLRLDNLGLGLASSLSAWAFLGIQAVYYITGKSEWKFSLRACRWRDMPAIVRLGYPGALSRFVEMFRCMIVNALVMNYVGSAGISSFAASNSLLSIIWSLPFGMVAVARMLFSVSMGEEDRKTLADSMKLIWTKGLLIQCGVSLVLVVLAEPLTMLFYRDVADPVYNMTVMGFRLLPLCMPAAVLTLTFASYYQTAEKKAVSIVLPIVDGMVGVIAFSLILIPSMKMNGLYLANILNGAVCLMVVAVNSCIVRRRFPKNIEDLMVIPDSFGAGDKERMDLVIRNVDEVIGVSKKVTEFSGDHGVDNRRAIFAGLCLEEMAGNVVEHGFSKDGKKHSLDIRVVHSGDDIILRLRDDCVPFEPAEHLKVLEPADGIKDIGIRLVYGIAGEVRYQSLLGLNVLTIRI